MERKIGEIFKRNDEWYQCVKSDGTCNGCVGKFQPYSLCNDFKECTGKIFKKLEKVGEPYMTGNKLIQRYKIYPTTCCINVYGWYYQNLDVESWTIDIEIKQTKEEMEEKKLNLKPFDLQKAKEGKPVCTRDGRKARIVCFDAKRKDKKSIIALVPSRDYPGFEDLIAYPNNGNYHGGHENDGDLMMHPEKKEEWVNIYEDMVMYTSEEEAKMCIATERNYIATAKVEWEE